MKIDKKIFPYAVAIPFVLAITIPAWLFSYKNEMINAGIFIATVVLALIGYVQLGALREQANVEFMFNFNRDFFNNKAIEEIIITMEKGEHLLKENSGKFTEYQLDDYLGYFELIALYEKKGIMDFDLIDEVFGHCISLAGKNEEIKQYIEKLRKKENDPRYYDPFEKLADKIIHREKEVRSATRLG